MKTLLRNSVAGSRGGFQARRVSSLCLLDSEGRFSAVRLIQEKQIKDSGDLKYNWEACTAESPGLVYKLEG